LTVGAKGKKSLRDFPLVSRIEEPLRRALAGSLLRRSKSLFAPLVRTGRGFDS